MFTIYGGLHPKSDVDRLYVPKKDGGKGLIVIDGSEVASALKKAKKNKRLQNYKEKALDDQCMRQSKEVRSEQVGFGFRMEISKERQQTL